MFFRRYIVVDVDLKRLLRVINKLEESRDL